MVRDQSIQIQNSAQAGAAYSTLLRKLIAGGVLDAGETSGAIGAIIDERWTAAQAAAFLAAVEVRGKRVSEVVGAVQAMRARSVKIEHDLPIVVDVCGTGGDGKSTFNISTTVAFVVAACGVPVAKHGNRAASSTCGSADVLQSLGLEIDLAPEVCAVLLRETRFTFCFAQRYHPAMRAVASLRRELGVPTLFNVLGPLLNPARATHQVVGVAAPELVDIVGEALLQLGTRGCAVVHAANGLDEVAGDAPTDVFQVTAGGVRRWHLDPAKYGVHAPLASLRGGDAHSNANTLLAILRGERSPRAGVVALNAALALLVAESVDSIEEGLARAHRVLADGSALGVLQAQLPAERRAS